MSNVSKGSTFFIAVVFAFAAIYFFRIDKTLYQRYLVGNQINIIEDEWKKYSKCTWVNNDIILDATLVLADFMDQNTKDVGREVLHNLHMSTEMKYYFDFIYHNKGLIRNYKNDASLKQRYAEFLTSINDVHLVQTPGDCDNEKVIEYVDKMKEFQNSTPNDRMYRLIRSELGMRDNSYKAVKKLYWGCTVQTSEPEIRGIRRTQSIPYNGMRRKNCTDAFNDQVDEFHFHSVVCDDTTLDGNSCDIEYKDGYTDGSVICNNGQYEINSAITIIDYLNIAVHSPLPYNTNSYIIYDNDGPIYSHPNSIFINSITDNVFNLSYNNSELGVNESNSLVISDSPLSFIFVHYQEGEFYIKQNESEMNYLKIDNVGYMTLNSTPTTFE